MSADTPHEVRENPYSVTARRSSTKAGTRMVRAESLLEYDFYSILDFDFRIEKYKEQPLVIPWRTPGGQYRRYTPDVLIKPKLACRDAYPHLAPTIYEIKPSQVVRDHFQDLLPKYRGIRRSLQGTLVPFKVMTERHLNPAFVANCKFLNQYSDKALQLHRASSAQLEMHKVISRKAENLGVTTPKLLIEAISPDFHTKTLLIPWMWNLMVGGGPRALQAHLIEPLTMDTEIWHWTVERGDPKWLWREHDWYR